MASSSLSESRNSLVRICKLARTLDLYRDSYDDAHVQDSSHLIASAAIDEEESIVKKIKYEFSTQVENVFSKNGPTFRGRTSAYTKRRTIKSKYVREKSTSHSEFASVIVSPNNNSDLSSSKFHYFKVRICAS